MGKCIRLSGSNRIPSNQAADEQAKRVDSVIRVIKYIIGLAGFELIARIEIRDRRTGRSGSDSMSYARYDWWGYVRAVVRSIQACVKIWRIYTRNHWLLTTAVCHEEAGRGAVEALVIRELPSCKQREYEAVCAAIRDTERMENGSDRLKVVDWVHWKRSLTISGGGAQGSLQLQNSSTMAGGLCKTGSCIPRFFDD